MLRAAWGWLGAGILLEASLGARFVRKRLLGAIEIGRCPDEPGCSERSDAASITS
jgi:hypothetical protein